MFSEQKLQFEPISQNEINKAKHYGKTIPLIIDENGEPKYLLGPHFYIFFIAWILSFIVLVYITFKLYPYCHVAVMVVCVLSGCCFLYYYGKVGFSLPGIASSGIEPDEESRKNIRYCKPCKIIKQPGTKHCYYCDVCILKIDHHCPWVGKCIGRDNICLFYVFLMSVGVAMLMYTLATITADFK